MSNYILKYSRDERVKYISHLDFVRLFHRTVRRTGMNFMFSNGFNPHPIMMVAQPLSVGVTSDCEYMKVGFDGDYSEQELVDTINNAFPPGYKILAAKKVEGKEIDLTKLDRAVYTVELEYEGSADIEKLLAQNELKVMKKSKSGVKESDTPWLPARRSTPFLAILWLLWISVQNRKKSRNHWMLWWRISTSTCWN